MRRRALLPVVLGLVLAVGGLLLARQPRAFGWFAYTPLSEATFAPGIIVLDAVGIAALVIAGLGIALLAGAAGYGLGQRSARRAGSADGDG